MCHFASTQKRPRTVPGCFAIRLPGITPQGVTSGLEQANSWRDRNLDPQLLPRPVAFALPGQPGQPACLPGLPARLA
jgi:hypothetical protein